MSSLQIPEDEESDFVPTKRTKTNTSPAYYSGVYVVIVGINNYDEDPQKGAANDAKRMKELYESKNYTIFAYLLEEQATKKEILQTFDNLANSIKSKGKKSLVIFHFSGQGVYERKKRQEIFHLSFFNGENIQIEEELRVKLEELECNVLCVLDCFFVGGVYNELERFKLPSEKIVVSSENKGIFVLINALADTREREIQGKHVGILTHYVDNCLSNNSEMSLFSQSSQNNLVKNRSKEISLSNVVTATEIAETIENLANKAGDKDLAVKLFSLNEKFSPVGMPLLSDHIDNYLLAKQETQSSITETSSKKFTGTPIPDEFRDAINIFNRGIPMLQSFGAEEVIHYNTKFIKESKSGKAVDMKDIFEVLKQNNNEENKVKLLLRGKRFVGKTTLCKLLTKLHSDKKIWKDEYMITFYVSFRDFYSFYKNDQKDIYSYIYNHIYLLVKKQEEDKKVVIQSSFCEIFRKLNEEGKIFVIFDDFDQKNISSSHQSKNEEAKHYILKKSGLNKLLICTSSLNDNIQSFEGFTQIELHGFDEMGRSGFIEFFFGNKKKSKENFINFIKLSPYNSFSLNPLNLVILCHIFENTNDVSFVKKNIKMGDFLELYTSFLIGEEFSFKENVIKQISKKEIISTLSNIFSCLAFYCKYKNITHFSEKIIKFMCQKHKHVENIEFFDSHMENKISFASSNFPLFRLAVDCGILGRGEHGHYFKESSLIDFFFYKFLAGKLVENNINFIQFVDDNLSFFYLPFLFYHLRNNSFQLKIFYEKSFLSKSLSSSNTIHSFSFQTLSSCIVESFNPEEKTTIENTVKIHEKNQPKSNDIILLLLKSFEFESLFKIYEEIDINQLFDIIFDLKMENKKDNTYGKTIFHHICQNPSINYHLLKYLSKKQKLELLKQKDQSNKTSYHYLLENTNNPFSILQFCKENKINLNLEDNEENTPFHCFFQNNCNILTPIIINYIKSNFNFNDYKSDPFTFLPPSKQQQFKFFLEMSKLNLNY
eukprot:TRINITY_DN948_c1_g1_i1.p1 TRINITY_DN948_c1_g1~~TRINITY_DN948_c1_g1_i1.p1  ORF type:complete len:1128 (-),score=392.76 TRINITY_DN948_c1_g1_i1:34-3027(-)